jgi:hypothetical protein
MYHRSPEIERNDSRRAFRDAVRSLPAGSPPTPPTPGLYLAQRDQNVSFNAFPRDAHFVMNEVKHRRQAK